MFRDSPVLAQRKLIATRYSADEDDATAFGRNDAGRNWATPQRSGSVGINLHNVLGSVRWFRNGRSKN